MLCVVLISNELRGDVKKSGLVLGGAQHELRGGGARAGLQLLV